MKKKVLGIILCGLVLLGTCGCGKNDSSKTGTSVKNKISTEGKSLVVYFSLPETNDPNNMSTEEENSAIVVDGVVYGNVQYMAKVISEKTNSDIFRIEPKTPYTTNHTDLVNQAKKEQTTNTRPEIKDTIKNFEQYDTIYIGYPIWWSDMPMIIYNFLKSYDFSNKNIYIFSSHGGSEIAGTDFKIKDILSNANVNTNYLSISRNSMETTPTKVDSWLQKLGIIN